MIVNGHKIPRPQFVAYDGCHKIYIPVKGRERGFVRRMEEKGYMWPEDYCKIDNAADLAELYVYSCSLRFIEQINFEKKDGEWKETYTQLIPQCAFLDNNDDFDDELARAAFSDF